MDKKYLMIGLSLVAVIIIATVFAAKNQYKPVDTSVLNSVGEITLYKSETCGCCSLYIDYLERNTELTVNVVDAGGDNSIKDRYNIPLELRSCHTAIYGDYFVEGHVPLEAIVKLIQEKPAIKGIALEGMPLGAPGMSGSPEGKFTIYAIQNDGSITEFMTI